MDVGDEASVERAKQEAKAKAASLQDDLREVLAVESGAGRRVLRWIVYDLAALMSSGWDLDDAKRCYFAGQRDLAGTINAELEAAREGATVEVLLEGSGVQPTEGKKR